MGQKVNPKGFRLILNRDWDSIWHVDKDKYIINLHEDIKIRSFINKTFKHALVNRVVIKRQSNIVVNIHAVRAGVIIGKNGADIEKASQYVRKITNIKDVDINVVEIKKPELCARLIAANITQQLEKRVSFRKAMKRAVTSSLRFGVKGIKISCSGRLGGAEIARTEWYKEGRMPLHTLRANIDYALVEAHTVYGIIGTKVWVYS
ncbi:30S ribosomal subunit protein S3 [Candidatus Xenohaliotis californiensis]|uniref:Small ribosomal subunit protein uS3 n=1 Tax=Candidatus Xenohaliotis californiensis TaxID=84677 RepID=A0ABM9N8J5_9RICK|nr:30S ribosomal subunit protein S3 [Candidatus Xenohaliotis californiensis]